MVWIDLLKSTFTKKDLSELSILEIEKINELLHQGKIWQVDCK
jgi:hypothetical protein